MITFSIFGTYDNKQLAQLRLVFRECGCFGSMQHTNAFVNSGFHSIIMDARTGAISGSNGNTSSLKSDEKFLAVGWCADGSLSWSGDATDYSGRLLGNFMSGAKNVLDLVNPLGIPWVHHKGLNAGSVPSRYKLSEYEKDVALFFANFDTKSVMGKAVSNSLARGGSSLPIGFDYKNADMASILLMIEYAKRRGVMAVFSTFVGADRRASYCVDFLMSYRNVWNACAGDRNPSVADINSSLKAGIISRLYEIRQLVDPFACLSYLCHYGDDSEIFVHAGYQAEVIGAACGFQVLEPFCHGTERMETLRRYEKGYQSSRLSNNLRESNFSKALSEVTANLKRLGTDCYNRINALVRVDAYDLTTRFLSDKPTELKINNHAILDYVKWLNDVKKVSEKVNKAMEGSLQSNYVALAKKKESFGEWIVGTGLVTTATSAAVRPGQQVDDDDDDDDDNPF